jgi:hypothetical protein
VSRTFGRAFARTDVGVRRSCVPMRKDICSRCVAAWSDADEEVWADGLVFCPAVGVLRERSLGIPEGCHMCLEYVMVKAR